MRSPVAYHPDALPICWPGGELAFPVDAAFYLAVQRAELTHLAHNANTFHDLHRDGEPPPELHYESSIIAVAIFSIATEIWINERKWLPNLAIWEGPSDWFSFALSVENLTSKLESMRKRATQSGPLQDLLIESGGELICRATLIKFAHLASTPAMLSLYRLILSRAPDLRINPEWIANTPVDPEPLATVKAPEAKPARGKPRNQGKTDRCKGIYMAALEEGKTPPAPTEIAALAGCSVAIASRAIKRCEDQRKELARQDAASRYRDHDTDEDVA